MSLSGPRLPHPLLEWGSYVAAAFGAVSGALLQRGHVVGDGVDMYGTFWFYWWIARCVARFEDPSFTDLMFHPLGKDIFAHTGDNFVDALASVPFQWALGFPRYQPWFCAVILLGNAWTFRLLARQLLGPGYPAWGATLLWVLNPFALFELMTGRLTQAFLWFLPLSFAFFLRAGREAGWRAPVAAGLSLGMLGWSYWFYGWFAAVGLAWVGALELARGRVPRRALLGRYALAAGACLALVGPGVVAMAMRASAGAVPGLVGAEGGGVLDGPGQLANNVASMLHGYVLLERQGQPIFASLVWGGGLAAWALAGRLRLEFGVIAILAFLFAVGPIWPTEGAGLVMPHYMAAYRYLPFFDRLWFPYRIVVMAVFAATIGVGTVLSRVEATRRLPGWLPPLALAVVGAVEQHRHLAFPLVHRELVPPQVYAVLGELGGGLVEAPVGMARISIAWQPVHGQPTFGGMGENAPIFWPEGYRERLRNRFVRFLRDVTRDPGHAIAFPTSDVERLRADGFRWVVLDRHLVDSDLHHWMNKARISAEERDRVAFVAQDAITARLGRPVAVDGPLVVWDLDGGGAERFPAALRPTEEGLRTRTWKTDDMPVYEAHLRELGRAPDR